MSQARWQIIKVIYLPNEGLLFIQWFCFLMESLQQLDGMRHRKNILGLEGQVKQETVQTVLFLEFCLEQCEPLASILCIWYSGTRTHGHLSGIAQTLHKNTCVYVCGSVNLKFRVRKSSRSFYWEMLRCWILFWEWIGCFSYTVEPCILQMVVILTHACMHTPSITHMFFIFPKSWLKVWSRSLTSGYEWFTLFHTFT